MRVFYRKNISEEIEKAIDEYVSSYTKGVDKILFYLRIGIINFEAIPKAKQTKELLLAYLDMPEIVYVRAKWISKRLLDDEVWSKLAPKCHDYEDIPQKFLTREHYYSIVRSEYNAKFNLHLIPVEELSEELLIEALAITFSSLNNYKLDKRIFEKFDIDALKKKALKLRNQRKKEQKLADELEIRKQGWITYKKRYDPEKGKFIFYGKPTNHSDAQNLEFDSFDEFYTFILRTLPEERKSSDHPHPLAWVDLSEYDFNDIDLSKYDLTGCLVRTEYLNDSQCFFDYSSKVLPESTDLNLDIYEDPVTAIVKYDDEGLICLGDTEAEHFIRQDYRYISDIHLQHRILNQIGSSFTKEQVAFFIRDLVENISEAGITLIAGDTSESFTLNKLFYTLLSEKSYGEKIIILGNHEICDESLYADSPVDDVVDAYREFFDEMGKQIFLQNELLIENSSYCYILSEKELLEKSCEELCSLCKDANIIILGGIGFTGYCHERDSETGRIYNAEYGLYGNAITTLEEDIRQTQKFEAVYKKVRDALVTQKVIVLTHTPKECWSREPYVADWIYVNGHTHRNFEIANDEMTIFADNQIGYHNKKVQLKTFCTIRNKDVFYEHLDDGIHEISVQQYREFNRSKGIYAHVDAEVGKILMIKKNNHYMFLLKRFVKSLDREKLYILDGGVIHSADYDEQYYFDNIDTYVIAVKSAFNNYWDEQKRIAQTIKCIGGNGRIHGCIIDIDFYDHAYLNPFDGSLTFYYAKEMTNKYVYENLGALLENKIKSTAGKEREIYIEMVDNYRNLLLENNKEDLQEVTRSAISVRSTDIYKYSRIIRQFRYIEDNNIIRIWKDSILTHYKDKENNQLMDISLVFNTENF